MASELLGAAMNAHDWYNEAMVAIDGNKITFHLGHWDLPSVWAAARSYDESLKPTKDDQVFIGERGYNEVSAYSVSEFRDMLKQMSPYYFDGQ